MKKNVSDNPFLRFFKSTFFIIVGFALVGIIGVSYSKSVYEDYKIKQEIAVLESELSDLHRKKLESLDMLSYVMSDDFVEEKARTELNLQSPGEQVIIFHGTKETQDPLETLQNPVKKQVLTNPQKWWKYFTQKNN